MNDNYKLQALNTTFKEHYKLLLKISGKVLHSHFDAEDNVQKTYEQCHKRLHQLRDVTSIKNWVSTACHFNAINQFNKSKRERELIQLYSFLYQVQHKYKYSEYDLIDILSTFEDAEKEFLILYYAVGYSYKELSFIYNVSPTALRSRMSRIREKYKLN